MLRDVSVPNEMENSRHMRDLAPWAFENYARSLSITWPSFFLTALHESFEWTHPSQSLTWKYYSL